MEDLKPFSRIAKTWQIFFKRPQSLAFAREKFKKLKYVAIHLMVKVNKKKSINNNNILKVELEYLRLATLLNNNLEFQ